MEYIQYLSYSRNILSNTFCIVGTAVELDMTRWRFVEGGWGRGDDSTRRYAYIRMFPRRTTFPCSHHRQHQACPDRTHGRRLLRTVRSPPVRRTDRTSNSSRTARFCCFILGVGYNASYVNFTATRKIHSHMCAFLIYIKRTNRGCTSNISHCIPAPLIPVTL